ncbi:MAG: Restriction endonuclease [Candidatus Kentron sp. G]|nr:MAG: Restriction endonuclease [Candidatus Kentron sp. G]VFM95730.1 MAG: Restriction endonuclease [Candidatus Kentron sp. G]VFM97507.1 MAG: Restriction endonuclease [Candidatus Kentron sp. G]
MPIDPSNGNSFETIGSKTDEIDVRISHRIIQLFSEGLYASPNKAVEELVSNSFDAGAENVHIILSPDLRDADATIVVIDDGEGMNPDGLKKHWIIGESTRRKTNGSSRRKPIGKFGIGKLSTYVLASKLTHICKFGDTYYAATMDYSRIGDETKEDARGVFDEKKIPIPLRTLTEQQARDAVRPWISGGKAGYRALRLFGEQATESWTVAILSSLKEMGKKISPGRLGWVLQTAMPQQADFRLFLDGAPITSPKLDEPLERLVIGKDVIQISPPCPEGLIEREDENEPEDSVHRYGLYHDELLGRITGYIEIFRDELDRGKDKFGQSNGFFVYVHGRQVNVDDPGFGIERNLLRHGTFSRFRMVVHMDSLDEALRSSRESFQQGDLYKAAQNFLRAGFNLARTKLIEHERSQTPAALISARIGSAPASMTRRPLMALVEMVVEKKADPFYLRLPSGLSTEEQTELLEELKQRAEEEEGLLRATELIPLDSKDGVAVFDAQEGKLLLNTSHPFVAAFQESFTNAKWNLPIEILVMSEILMEAHLYHMGLDEKVIREVIDRRDELLRQLVRTSARRTAGMIALALLEARDDASKLEEEMRAAFEAMGFDNVIHIGGSGKPDGTADAPLSAAKDGITRRYKIGLEAKSGGKVSAKRLGVSGIERHMKEYNCDHHLVIGNSFATTDDEASASVKEIDSCKEKTGKTVTLMHIDDLARLVRIAPTKCVGGLSRLRELFQSCVTPEESKAWVDSLEAEETENWPYKEILETIWERAGKRPDTVIEYSAVMTALEYRNPPINISKKDLFDCCRSVQSLVPGAIVAYDNTVEIDRRPDLILEDIRAAVGEYPEEERRTISI